MQSKPLGQYVIKYDVDLSMKFVSSATDKPIGTFVKEDGTASDKAAPTSFYGLHVGDGQVCRALAVLNNHGIQWPDTITENQKAAAIAHIEKSHMIVRGL